MVHRSAATAFTLVEAIIAIVILAVAVPPMLWAINDSHSARIAPLLTARARWLAAEKLEDVIADRHSMTRGYAYVATSNYPAEPTIAGFAGFARSVAIAETGPAFAPEGTGYKLVTVTVTWADARSQPRALSLSTVITDY